MNRERKPSVQEDPFELLMDDAFFETSSPMLLENVVERPQVPKKAPPVNAAAVPVNETAALPRQMFAPAKSGFFVPAVICAMIVGMVGISAWWLWPRPEPLTTFAYFEMRAIGPEGRPVAGAMVKQGEATLGLTDSFGEWRRYMRVKLGSTLVLNIHKKQPHGLLRATKNIAVPATLPKSGDLEIKTQIGLLGPAAPSQAPVVAENEPPPAPRSVAPEQPVSPAPALPVASEAPKGDNLAHAAATVSPAAPQPPAPSTPAIWVEEIAPLPANAGDQAMLRNVSQNLKESYRQGGYEIAPTAALVLQIGLLRSPAQQTSLFYVRGRLARFNGQGGAGQPGAEAKDTGKALFSFLRSWQGDSRKAAEDLTLGFIRYGLSPKASDRGVCEDRLPCELFQPPIAFAPPLPKWQKMWLKIVTPHGGNLEIFASGFVAKPVGDQLYEFWAPPAGPTNVTVVQGQTIVFRDKVLPSSTSPVSLAIGGGVQRSGVAPLKI
jgi:hypothetical protein